GYNHFYERTCPVYDGVPSSVGSGTAADPYINSLTVHFEGGIGGQSTEGNENDPYRPSWSCNRRTTYGVIDFHAFLNGTNNSSSSSFWFFFLPTTFFSLSIL